MNRQWDIIDAEAERIFGHQGPSRLTRYRNAMASDPETRWNEAVNRVLQGEASLKLKGRNNGL